MVISLGTVRVVLVWRWGDRYMWRCYDDVMGIIELSKVSIPGCFWPFRFAGVLIVSKIAGFLVHSRSRREPIPSQLQLPLLRKNRPPA